MDTSTLTGDSVTIRPVTDSVISALDALASQADGEGIRIVKRVVDAWRSGDEVFDQPGETLLAAIDGSKAVIGIGGLTLCPTVEGALRVRRFYVDPAWRRRGVATRLASTLIATGQSRTSIITCNAGASAAARPFWESMGFAPVERAGITHELRVQ